MFLKNLSVWVSGLLVLFLLVSSVEAQQTAPPSSAETSAPPSSAPFFRCGCADCTRDVWVNSLADGFSCGIRISFAINVDDMTELDACTKISNDFPTECGAFCNPNECASTRCGCQECTDEVLDADMEFSVCRDRIDIFKNPQGAGMTEVDACLEASQYCGFQCSPCPKACNPRLCDGKGSPICSCTDCELDTVVDPNDLGNPTCEDKLLAIWYEQLRTNPLADREVACQMVAEQYPLHCGNCRADTCGEPRTYCGCQNCTEEVWERQADDFTCGGRIRFVAFELPDGERPITDACSLIAEEYPSICGPECDPNLCLREPMTTVFPTTPGPTRAATSSFPTQSPRQPLTLPPTADSVDPSTDEPTRGLVVPPNNRPVLPTIPPSGAFDYKFVSRLSFVLTTLVSVGAIGY